MFKSIISDIDLNPQTGLEGDNTQNLSTQYISRLGLPTKLIPGEATLEDIYLHAIYRQRLSQSTAQSRIRLLTNIAEHTIPVRLEDPQEEDWIRHSDYREQIEGATHALHNEWKAMRTLLKAYRMSLWDYRPPIITQHKHKELPHPDLVRKLIHHKYKKNKDWNRHFQYLIQATFMMGLRVPSELVLMKTSDIDLDRNIIVITEPKKRKCKRSIAVHPLYLKGRNCKSLQYWIDHIRPRYTTQHSEDFLFITYSGGKPYSRDYLRSYLQRNIVPVYPEYHPYCSRHWSATGRLIQEYIQTGHWNKSRVQHWLGHDHESTTDSYIQLAEVYLQTAPYDWFDHVLKPYPKSRAGKHGKNQYPPHFCGRDASQQEKAVTDLWGYTNSIRREKDRYLVSFSFFFNHGNTCIIYCVFFCGHGFRSEYLPPVMQDYTWIDINIFFILSPLYEVGVASTYLFLIDVYPPFSPILKKIMNYEYCQHITMTYKVVCQNIYILCFWDFSITNSKLSALCYVMLCYFYKFSYRYVYGSSNTLYSFGHTNLYVPLFLLLGTSIYTFLTYNFVCPFFELFLDPTLYCKNFQKMHYFDQIRSCLNTIVCNTLSIKMGW